MTTKNITKEAIKKMDEIRTSLDKEKTDLGNVSAQSVKQRVDKSSLPAKDSDEHSEEMDEYRKTMEESNKLLAANKALEKEMPKIDKMTARASSRLLKTLDLDNMPSEVKAKCELSNINLFSVNNEAVCAESNARYIYVILDDKDKKLLIMLMLPHIRKVLIKDGKLDSEAVAKLIDWEEPISLSHAVQRIKRLCEFGAIVIKPDGSWVANPKVASQVSTRG